MNTKVITQTGTELALTSSRELVSSFPTGEDISALVAATRAQALRDAAEFDINTPKGRASIISVSVGVRDKKVALEKAGDVSKVDHQAAIKQINAGVKTVKEEFQTVQDEIRQPVTDWETANETRKKGLRTRLSVLGVGILSSDSDSDDIRRHIDSVARTKIDDSWQEFLTDAAKLKDATLETLGNFLELSSRREAMEKELEERRAADAERDRLDAYEAMQRQAEVDNAAFDQALFDAEIARAEVAEAERRRVEQAAEEATKAAEEKAETDRKAVEAAHKLELELANQRAEMDAQKERDILEADRKRAVTRQEARDRDTKLRKAAAKDIANHIKDMNRDDVLIALMANEIPHITLTL